MKNDSGIFIFNGLSRSEEKIRIRVILCAGTRTIIYKNH